MLPDFDNWLGFYYTIRSESVLPGVATLWERGKVFDGDAITIFSVLDSIRDKVISDERKAQSNKAKASSGGGRGGRRSFKHSI